MLADIREIADEHIGDGEICGVCGGYVDCHRDGCWASQILFLLPNTATYEKMREDVGHTVEKLADDLRQHWQLVDDWTLSVFGAIDRIAGDVVRRMEGAN